MRMRKLPDVILDAGDGDSFLVTISDESMRAAFRLTDWFVQPQDSGGLWVSPDVDIAPYGADGEVSAAAQALFDAPVILDVGEVGEAEKNALSRLTWRPDLNGWLFESAPQAEYDRYSAETSVTVIEADGGRWTTRLPIAVLNDRAALFAAISGDLHDVHPRDYVQSWEPGDPLPTLDGACVHLGGQLITRLTDAVVVGAGSIAACETESSDKSYLIYRNGEPVWVGSVVAWYADEPDRNIVALHTNGAGGLVVRLPDGARLDPGRSDADAAAAPDGP